MLLHEQFLLRSWMICSSTSRDIFAYEGAIYSSWRRRSLIYERKDLYSSTNRFCSAHGGVDCSSKSRDISTCEGVSYSSWRSKSLIRERKDLYSWRSDQIFASLVKVQIAPLR
ncbi:hypothetical protein Ddye_004978 [Dipteronia dyeriana]|uniref:Uncharacterized protein n=1 Tax=Dipteronia dyeriana TaxID=168575 RepID=A0AAD9XFN2_9ROSI|nr:hypothetical protein Ddye_004978 [Dipteronia dyeriana]